MFWNKPFSDQFEAHELEREGEEGGRQGRVEEGGKYGGGGALRNMGYQWTLKSH